MSIQQYEHSISPTSMVGRNPDHLAADLDGELVLMSVENGKYYSLDTIGSDIWNRLEHKVVVADLCAALKLEYAADSETIFLDVQALLGQLAAKGLIEIFP